MFIVARAISMLSFFFNLQICPFLFRLCSPLLSDYSNRIDMVTFYLFLWHAIEQISVTNNFI